MRLRKCSDIALINSLYFELLDDSGAAILNIHQSDLEKVIVSIGSQAFDFDQFVGLLNEARDQLMLDLDN